MIHVVNSPDANGVWGNALRQVDENGVRRDNSTKGGSREILHFAFSIANPRQRWISNRVPTINPSFALSEVVWIMQGRNDLEFLNSWNSNLSKFVGHKESLHGAYGHRLRNHFGFDQLIRAAETLKNNPQQRQIVIQIWDPKIDAPGANGHPQDPDIPCNITSMIKICNGHLEWTQIMRSNDLVMGLPYNVIQWTTIQEIFAGWLNLQVGTYNQMSDSLHIYDRDSAEFSIRRKPDTRENTDDLRLGITQSRQVFSRLEKDIQALAGTSSAKTISEVVSTSNLPEGYMNWLRLMACERFRRIGAKKLTEEILETISNEALHEMQRLWIDRHKRI